MAIGDNPETTGSFRKTSLSQGALELGRSGRHLAVIIEPRMPGGERLLDDLRASSRDGKPNLIVVTSDGKHAYGDGRGVSTVLRKPFSIEELAAAVAKCSDGDGAG